MAEILLSLTIIGVVAAITLPSLTGNINERTWNTQRKALHARMSQALLLMPNLNGYGSSDDWEGTAAETFVSAGLSKVLKINNICDDEHLADCGLPAQITTLKGNSINFPTDLYKLSTTFEMAKSWAGDAAAINTKVAGFESQNGESIAVFYDPMCTYKQSISSDYEEWFRSMCANFVYDLNGSKGPNAVGKDVGFITAFYPTDTEIVAPVLSGQLSSSQMTYENGVAYCKNMDETRLPNIYEVDSMVVNDLLIDMKSSLLSGSFGMLNNQKAVYFVVWGDPSNFLTVPDSEAIANVQCVKR